MASLNMSDELNKHAFFVLQPLYEKYNGTGFSPALVGFYAPTFAICSIGILLNTSLVFVTIKSRSTLCNSFNVLICVESLSAALLQYSYALPFLIALCGRNLVPARLCFLASWPGLFGGVIQTHTMLYISLERLHCILFPNAKVSRKRAKFYLLLLNAISLSIGMGFIALTYKGMLEEFNGRWISCYMQDYTPPLAGRINYSVQALLQLATVVDYLLIWILILPSILKKIAVVSERNLHVLKSISVIMSFLISGWIVIQLSPLYYTRLGLSRDDTLTFFAVMIAFNLFASSINGPVLYIFSSDYRKCYQRVFPWLPRGKSHVAVAPMVASSSGQQPLQPPALA